jgi:hypothetical protein
MCPPPRRDSARAEVRAPAGSSESVPNPARDTERVAEDADDLEVIRKRCDEPETPWETVRARLGL